MNTIIDYSSNLDSVHGWSWCHLAVKNIMIKSHHVISVSSQWLHSRDNCREIIFITICLSYFILYNQRIADRYFTWCKSPQLCLVLCFFPESNKHVGYFPWQPGLLTIASFSATDHTQLLHFLLMPNSRELWSNICFLTRENMLPFVEVKAAVGQTVNRMCWDTRR